MRASLHTAQKLGRVMKENDRLPQVLIVSMQVLVKTVF